jgi:hypothetical protein
MKAFGYPWLALGGGGYAIEVVPRSWSLAVGIMADLALPDLLPDAYSNQYGGQWLHDRQQFQAGPSIMRALEVIVEQVQHIHGV